MLSYALLCASLVALLYGCVSTYRDARRRERFDRGRE